MATASVLSLETNHEDMVHDVQWDYYAKRIASCSSDRSIKIIEMNSADTNQPYRLQADLRGHEGPVWEVAWAHPRFGSLLASCSYDRKVQVWKESTPGAWSVIFQYAGHELSVNSVAWAPHEAGLILAAASSDGFVSIHTFDEAKGSWDSKKFHAHQVGASSVSWAPSVVAGSLVQAPGQAQPVALRFVSGGCDNLVKVWRYNEGTKTWDTEHVLDQHQDWVRDVAWAPNVGLPSSTIASCSQDQTVVIWTSDDSSGAWVPKALPKFGEVVWTVSWSVTGHLLLVSGGDDKVTVWKEGLDGTWSLVENVEQGAPQTH
eukprot:TRINITY_DN6651_c0_g1_i2.p1 TRINITY_DN6651_c0_g1~~TRINITY_DN6651_c0_g1_i2.p1  ORF type:complete len:317 (-),score=77.04 TRINITY_DN6651_c0_g1_i2:60-1010(-)